MSDPPQSGTHDRIITLIGWARGGVVFDAALAQRLGEVLLEAHYGSEELERQRPLIATDKGDYWRVVGSWNRDRKIDGTGAFYASIKKFDGGVLDFGTDYIIHPPPDARRLIEAHLRRQKSAKKE
jgi:hypothetical protein